MVEEHPRASPAIQDRSRAEAQTMIEALIDFQPEAGTPPSAAWKEHIVTLLHLVR